MGHPYCKERTVCEFPVCFVFVFLFAFVFVFDSSKQGYTLAEAVYQGAIQ